MAEAPAPRWPRHWPRPRRSRSRSRSRDEQPARASRSRDEQPAQSRADRGRFGSSTVNSGDRTSSRASTAPTREWLTDGIAYSTLHNELAFVKRSEPRTKLSLAGGRVGDTRDAWKETLRSEGVTLMENIAIAKRNSGTATSDTIKESHVLCASQIMRRTRLNNANANVRLMPTHDMSAVERATVLRMRPRLTFPDHENGELDWARWSAVCGMKGTAFARLANAVFGRDVSFSPKAKRVFARHLRAFIESIVPVIARYAREAGIGSSGKKINRELIELAANCPFSF